MFYKYNSHIQISREALADHLAERDPSMARKIKWQQWTPPSEEQKAAYRRACELLNELDKNPYFFGTDYYVEEPKMEHRIEYAETMEEWLDRVVPVEQ